MIKKLQSDFNQTALIAIIWVALLATWRLDNPISIWRIIAIGLLVGVVFGIVYPYLWQYSTLGSIWSVIISTLCNIGFQIGTVWLFSSSLFRMMMPYFLVTSVFTLLLHIFIFYYYQHYQNQKMAKQLNQIS